MGPKSLTELFMYKNATTSYDLRDSGSALCLPQPHTNSMKKSFMFDGASTWNALPNEGRLIESKKIVNNLFL
jgi:hypothetical protein